MTERSKRYYKYQAFLKSDKWKETKAKVYAKYSQTWDNVPEDRFICFDCGKNYPLKWSRFHHKSYRRSLFQNGWERTKHIRILCNSCHYKIHKEEIEKRKAEALIIEIGVKP